MKFWNLHTHSTFSDGKNSIDEMVKAAIDRGFCAIGMSDHSYTACDESYCMKPAQYPEYLAQIKKAKETYQGQIEVFIGMELDYFSDVDRSLFDYIIGSVHYVEANGIYYAVDHAAAIQQKCVDESFGGDFNAMAKRYYEELTTHILATHADIVGHFDVIAKFSLFDESDPIYQRTALEAMDAILETDAIFEVNTGAMARGYRKIPYPVDFLLRHILEKKGRITWGADCHATQNTDYAFCETLQLLRSLGFKSMAKPTANGFEDVGI